MRSSKDLHPGVPGAVGVVEHLLDVPGFAGRFARSPALTARSGPRQRPPGRRPRASEEERLGRIADRPPHGRPGERQHRRLVEDLPSASGRPVRLFRGSGRRTTEPRMIARGPACSRAGIRRARLPGRSRRRGAPTPALPRGSPASASSSSNQSIRSPPERSASNRRADLEEVIEVPARDRRVSPGGPRAAPGEVADRLEHREPRLVAPVATVAGGSRRPASSCSRAAGRPVASAQTASAAAKVRPPSKTAQPPEQDLLGLVEQVVAPGDRRPQRLLPLGQVARPAGQGVRAGRRAGRGSGSATRASRERRRARSRAARPSSRTQIAETSGAFWSVSRKSARMPAARAANSRTASLWMTASAVCGVPGIGHAERADRVLPSPRSGAGRGSSPGRGAAGSARRSRPRNGRDARHLLEIVEDQQDVPRL